MTVEDLRAFPDQFHQFALFDFVWIVMLVTVVRYHILPIFPSTRSSSLWNLATWRL